MAARAKYLLVVIYGDGARECIARTFPSRAAAHRYVNHMPRTDEIVDYTVSIAQENNLQEAK